LAWQNNRAIYVWDVRAGREIREIDISSSRDSPAAAISPDGRTVASGSFDGKIRLYDTATGARIREIRGHARRLDVLAFSPDGKMLAAGTSPLVLLDAATGDKVRTFASAGMSYRSLAFSPDGALLAGGGTGRENYLWDTATAQVVHTFRRFEIWAVAF